MYINLKQKMYKKYKIFLLVILAIIISIAGGWVIFDKYFATKDVTTPDENTTETIIYDEPTEKEKQDNKSFKQDLIDQIDNSSEQDNTNSSTKKTVTPTIVYVSQNGQSIEAGAFVSGIIEEVGSCNYKFAKNSTAVTKTTAGFANATTTNCTNLSFNKSELSSGTWSLVVTYDSNAATGSSAASTFEVK